MNRRPIAHQQYRRQRGTAYVLVLSITTMLVVMGLAATQIARGELERNGLESDQAAARLAALSLQDNIHKQLNGDLTWRDTASDGSWVFFGNIGGSRVHYAFIDQIDGDISNDAAQPFLLYTRAIHGDSRRIYVVELIPANDGTLTRNASSFRQAIYD